MAVRYSDTARINRGADTQCPAIMMATRPTNRDIQTANITTMVAAIHLARV